MGWFFRALQNPDRVRVYLKSKVSGLLVQRRYEQLDLDRSAELKVSPVIWLRTPKCASSSILAILESADRVVNCIKHPEIHLTDDLLRNKVICISAGNKEEFVERHPDIWGDAFKWAVVRNPYDRVISAWRYLDALRALPLEQVLANPPSKNGAPSDYHHFTRSFSSMLTRAGELVVDCVIKYEELDSELPTLFENIGVPYVGLAHVNETPGRKPKGQVVSNAGCEKIQQLFRDDFELFGYEP